MNIVVSPLHIALIIILYFVFIILISYLTGKNASNQTFYLGDKNSKWYVVAYGMVGATLSGVTFISVPGWVAERGFSYMQMVLGYLLGYLVIAKVLLPLYYRLNVTSIYAYLHKRFNIVSYKSGALLFLISRLIGASMRLYLMASVLQLAVFDAFGVPFVLTVLITLVLIWLYTYRGGIKTIIWTDTLQTTFMLLAVVFTVFAIASKLGWSFGEMAEQIASGKYAKVWFFDDFRDKQFFFKQFLSGAFITIVMTGLDQDMMQKNLTCRNLNDAKKNMFWFSLVLVPVNLLFLALGALLYIFAAKSGYGVPENADMLYPILATQGYLGPAVSIMFIIGLVAAAYSSADSALTSLTTSFTIDILGRAPDDERSRKTRIWVHMLLTLVIFGIIIVFKALNDKSVIDALFTLAGYTYGPLLGLFAFGLFTKRNINDKLVPVFCIVAPALTHIIKINAAHWKWMNGYQFDFEILLLNGLIMTLLLYVSGFRMLGQNSLARHNKKEPVKGG